MSRAYGLPVFTICSYCASAPITARATSLLRRGSNGSMRRAPVATSSCTDTTLDDMRPACSSRFASWWPVRLSAIVRPVGRSCPKCESGRPVTSMSPLLISSASSGARNSTTLLRLLLVSTMVCFSFAYFSRPAALFISLRTSSCILSRALMFFTCTSMSPPAGTSSVYLE